MSIIDTQEKDKMCICGHLYEKKLNKSRLARIMERKKVILLYQIRRSDTWGRLFLILFSMTSDVSLRPGAAIMRTAPHSPGMMEKGLPQAALQSIGRRAVAVQISKPFSILLVVEMGK